MAAPDAHSSGAAHAMRDGDPDRAILLAGNGSMNWLKHAFGTDPPGPAEPDESQRMLIEKLSTEIIRRRLTTPAVFVLEMSRPLNYVSAQLLHFFQPIVAIVADADGYNQVARFLERRGSIDYIVRRIDALEAAAHGQVPPVQHEGD